MTSASSRKEGLEVELLWTAGGADAQQATINGSVDLAVQTGLSGILSAIQRGAPIVIVGSDMTGASDLIWYTRTESPIKSLADLGPNDNASFSRPGASSETVIKSLLEHFKSKGKGGAVGQPARDADAGDVGPDRRRLGHGAIAEGLRRGQGPHRRARQRLTQARQRHDTRARGQRGLSRQAPRCR